MSHELELWEESGDNNLIWADVGERLGLTVEEIRGIDRTFRDYLGLSPRQIPERLLPVIRFIAALRRQGMPDTDIQNRLDGIRGDNSWPDDILTRMATEPVSMQVPDAVSESVPEPADEPPEALWRRMFMDLRCEMEHLAVSEREILHRMNQNLQRLTAEIRDLRYALLLSSSRRNRKRGKRDISGLL